MKKQLTARELPEAITLGAFSERYGYSRDAVNGKIRNGVWLEGREFFKAPDGKIHIIIAGYHKWLYSEARAAKRNIEQGYFEHA